MARIHDGPLKNRNAIPDKGIDTSLVYGAQDGSGAHSTFCTVGTEVSFVNGLAVIKLGHYIGEITELKNILF
jgi:hypothetical protein